MTEEEQHRKWHEDPSNWKLGIFYYNPDDTRIFPPKRYKYFGWTVNFANGLSVLVFVSIVFILAAIITML